MDSFLTMLGMLFFMFLVLAATVEVILEMFRGLLESLGITFLKGKYTVDDALSLSGEFASGNEAIKTKIELIKSVAQQIEHKASDKINDLNMLKSNLSGVGVKTEDAAAELGKIAADIKKYLDDSESIRIFILRSLSAFLGCLIIWKADFYILSLLVDTQSTPDWIKNIHGLKDPVVNILIGGLGTAAGSSYWHDKLDQVRNLKSAKKQVDALFK